MSKGSLQIHSENILPIIKKWLYSARDIFVRELASNACDAIQKVKVLMDRGEIKPDAEEFRVDITIEKDAKTITFKDNGIGMSSEEVEKYIAQIAFSGAEDFVKKYQTKNEADQFIGHFGLGFYSAYMVSSKVEIDTLSYQPDAEAAFWSCDGSSEYALEKGSRTERGTTIKLFITEEHNEFLEEAKLKEVLNHYCSFLPYPIYLNGQRINTHEPLWMRPPSECTDKDYLEFYRYLYPFEEEPLFWMHLNVDYPFHLKGILYFPRIKKELDFAKHTVKLYCNRVFVADNCKDVIPEYLMVLRGVIDSPDIPLNVSRSYLQVDRTVKQLSGHISKKVSDSLSTLYKNDRSRYESSWDDIAPIIKLGVVQDEKFYERVKELLIWKTLKDEWLTLEEYKTRNEGKLQSKVLYTFDDKSEGHLHELYKEKAIDVLVADFRLDPYVFNTLETKNKDQVFKRIDSEIGDHLLDKDKEHQVLDADGKTIATHLADFYRRHLEGQAYEIEAKSLASEELPALIVIEENERRIRDYFKAMNQKFGLENMAKMKVVLNTNNSLVKRVAEIKDPELAKEMVREVIELSLLSQKEMDPSLLHAFIKRTHKVLTHLAEFAVEKS